MHSSSVGSILLPSHSQFGPCWSVSNTRPQSMLLVKGFIKEKSDLP